VSASTRARSLLREAASLNLDQADFPGSLRCVVGVMVPLVVGLSAGSVADGVYAAIGALCAGFASFQGAYRGRAAITVMVGAGMAAATVTGALAARADWSAIVVVAAWAFVVGMMAALGQAGLVVGLQWGVAVIIVNALPMTTGQALVRGAMILAGALVQTVLVVLAWPMRTYRPERTAVATVYRDLAAYAESVPRGSELGVASTGTDEARRALSDPHPLGRAGQLLAFQALVDEADRIRISLAALASLRRSVERDEDAVVATDRFLGEAASALRSVGTAILADVVPTNAGPVTERLQQRVEETGQAAEAGGLAAWLARDSARLVDALGGQLRSALRVAQESAVGPSARDYEGLRRPRHQHRPVAETTLTLRANLSRQSTIFRHAVRLAVTLTAAMIIYRLSGIPHGYWIALTALIVLRQDYNTTAVRGVSRIGGTIVGAFLATLLVAVVHPDVTGLAVMFGIVTWLAFVIVRVNYGLFSVCVTAYVVFLLAFAQAPVVATAGDRLISTLIGGGLAIGIYLVWPTWESRLVGPQIAALVGAQAEYAGGVLACHAEPASSERDRLNDLRTATRLARSNAEQSVSRMAAEPERSRRDAPMTLAAARGALAAARRSSLALLTLHAHLPAEGAPPLPAIGSFSAVLTERMRHNAAEVRHLVPTSSVEASAHAVLALVGRPAGTPRAPHDHPDSTLRDAHNALAEALSDLPDSEERPVALLVAETDELVDAANSMSRLVASSDVR
jgi:uncharacterized membrane protein YccC